LFADPSGREQWPATGACRKANNPGSDGQRLVQPAQSGFVDFHPVVPGRRFCAVLERPANTIMVKPNVVAALAVQSEQRPEKVHDRLL
jgi:hypothetical protein